MSHLSPQSRALLAASSDRDHISSADRLRIRRKLDRRIASGLAFGAALTTGLTTAEAARSTLLATAASWLPISAKIVGVVAIAGAATVGVAHWSQPSTPQLESRASAVKGAAVTARPHSSKLAALPSDSAVAAAGQTEPTASGDNGASPPRVAASARRGTRSGPSAEPTNPEGSPESISPLGAQVSAIRESRAAARRGDARAALAALDDESLASSKGGLGQEAMLARVKGLCLQGDPVAARRVADLMLARYPDSLLLTHVRASCAFQSGAVDGTSEP